MNPDVKVVNIHVQQMLAASLPTSDKTATEWGSREFDYDEDYEDEEEY